MKLISRFNIVLENLIPKQKKYIHYRSVRNFIEHLEEIEPHEEYEKCRHLLDEYVSILELEEKELNIQYSGVLFSDYIFPLSEQFKKIGFRQITPLRNQVFFSIHVDFFLWLFFLKYPLPIISILVLANYYLRTASFLKTTRVYGTFY